MATGQIKIDNGVIIPSDYKWPFYKLKLGQSFIAGEFSRELQRNMGSIGNYYFKKLGFKFSTKKTSTNKLRVWRVL